MRSPLRGGTRSKRDVGQHAEIDLAAVLHRHREPDALPRLLAQPARLQQRHLRATAAALRRPRPQIRDDRFDHPARVGLVLQVERVELGVEVFDRDPALGVWLQQARWPGLVALLQLYG